ncbi:MAG: hypothetical protein K2Q20_05620 [Phycisphaerales bacterium]|nr:hypothetical protein [Phycisphaerales bacterium]
MSTPAQTPTSAPRPSVEPRFLSPDVLGVFRCPTTRQPLEPRIVDGRPVLVTPDGSRVYPVRDGVPILLPLQPTAQGPQP